MSHFQNITNKDWHAAFSTCGYMLVPAFRGALASGRDISTPPLS